ncbi:hypothetical protein THIOM_003726, partial [Candidatus Thiomargarita nelsonii]
MTSTHEPFDDTAKAFYHRLFKSWGLSVETERVVFSRSRTIDLVVRCNDADQKRLQKTVFAHFRQFNALELKGFNDPLTVANYKRIMMRAWGLESQKPSASTDQDKLSELPNQMTVTIVCVTRPDNILDKFKQELRFVQIEAGIYYSDDVLGRWIIHPSELALVEKNYPLLPLARG